MEDICDRVGIVKDGKILLTLEKHDFKSYSGEGYLIVFRGNLEKLKEQLAFEELNTRLGIIETRKEDLFRTVETINNCGLEIIDIESKKKNLETLFIEFFDKEKSN